MKCLIFDTGSIISLALNDLLWILPKLKEKFGGEFIIPRSVKKELVETPLGSKKYELEAIMISKLIRDKVIRVYEENIDVRELEETINNIYSINNKPLHIVQTAELEALILAIKLDASAYVVDERTIRLVVENPDNLRLILENKLHTKVQINNSILKNLKGELKEINIIRSIELALVSLEKGILDQFIGNSITKKKLVDSLLWGFKLRGCAISTEEIDEVLDSIKN